ncbi:hypothetical protein V6N13_075351 [Hibiscus sabdariffa]|uniref:Uncharacterized protein n=1 Tax=Hibiscus sabdariffa TaxID=183260 RepID=A0ABR2UB75_9ROSI
MESQSNKNGNSTHLQQAAAAGALQPQAPTHHVSFMGSISISNSDHIPLPSSSSTSTTNVGNAFWMLTVGGGAPVSEAQMWSFPVHYSGGESRANSVHLGSMILQQQQTGGEVQQLGVDVGSTGINNNNRADLKMNLDQENQTQGSDRGNENRATDSQ